MNPCTWIALASLVLPAACRGPSSPASAAAGRGEDLSGGEPRGDPAVESNLALENPSLERTGDGRSLVFVLRNLAGTALQFEFCIQAYTRSGVALADGRTAWTLLSLGAHEARSLRTETLPASTESWRLIARRPMSR